MSASSNFGVPGNSDFEPIRDSLFNDYRAGNKGAVETLYAVYTRPSYFFVRTRGAAQSRYAKDIVHQFFATQWERREKKKTTVFDTFDSKKGPFRNWLMRYLRFFAIAYLRRVSRQPQPLPQNGPEDSPEPLPVYARELPPDRLFTRFERDEAMRHEIGLLAEEFKAKGKEIYVEAVRWHLDGAKMTNQEIAEKLGVKRYDVENYLKAFYRELRKRLKKKYPYSDFRIEF